MTTGQRMGGLSFEALLYILLSLAVTGEVQSSDRSSREFCTAATTKDALNESQLGELPRKAGEVLAGM